MNHEAYQTYVCANINKQNISAGAACEQAGRENYSRYALMLPALAIQVFSHPVLGSSERDEDLSERNEDAYRTPDPCIVCGEVHLPPGMRPACPASRPCKPFEMEVAPEPVCHVCPCSSQEQSWILVPTFPSLPGFPGSPTLPCCKREAH